MEPEEATAHGGAVFALADTVGGAALASLVGRPTPTVDMRIDYLAPGRSDLVARAEVVREGGSVGTVDVTVGDAEGTRVAEARGVYETG
nr:PaaI family thioesterase [Halomarina sp. PSR21]